MMALLASGCTSFQELGREEPTLPQITATRSTLLDMPPPANRVDIAVYDFEDQTGQFKPSDTVQTLSKAVSQGGGAVLMKALRDTGNGNWFRVVERSNLDNLLQERRIIQEMRQIYLKEKEINPKALPPMLFAGVILEGGVVGYDTNVLTGGGRRRVAWHRGKWRIPQGHDQREPAHRQREDRRSAGLGCGAEIDPFHKRWRKRFPLY
ncbi:CsgG/HfaB family protein [Roseovarius sp. SK2]|uniref:CsgG/HfaB family protein n=1 Tax=Roseovarius TaxID=74030 RepID=UPI00237A4AD1|nr:CsgG/HfaB family protein [Roseovarius sp. SK2]MDD9724822.1 CsgG/HfaB family protein [Roseovarius sp. SK2]